MRIIDFGYNHTEAARAIAIENYNQERLHNPDLPEMERVPDLTIFVGFGLGVTALDEEGRMLGFLCAYPPREDAFGTTGIRGTFVPIHAHGVRNDVTEGEKSRIYSRMYQAAADKWVRKGILSHGISLYAHDTAAQNSFFYNGFGIRCIDAIRSLEELTVKPVDLAEGNEPEYLELTREEWGELLDLYNDLRDHLGQSPTFMSFGPVTKNQLYTEASEDIRYFAVRHQGRYIAYVKLGNEGETFVSNVGSMMNICGAYCLPEYRGKGIYHNLLAFLISTLRAEGYLLLGVDCESINPNAKGFWLKYFSAYTHSVVRRIDDKANCHRSYTLTSDHNEKEGEQ